MRISFFLSNQYCIGARTLRLKRKTMSKMIILLFIGAWMMGSLSSTHHPVRIPERDRKYIIHGLQVKHGMSDEDARNCLLELEHFYTGVRYQVVDSASDRPPRIITNAWEIHIVHISMYKNFTESTFGRFLHYKPLNEEKGQLYVYRKLQKFGIEDMNESIWLSEDPEQYRYHISSAYWDDFYKVSDNLPQFNAKPNIFLQEFIEEHKPPLENFRILDIGMGQGRNSIWLAQQGYQVTGFDPSVEGIKIVRSRVQKLNLTTLEVFLAKWEDFDFGVEKWDLILSMYVGLVNESSYLTKLEQSLKYKGLFLMEAFHWDNLENNRTVPLGVTYKANEIPSLLRNLTIIKYDEPMGHADFGNGPAKLIRYIGQRQFL